MLPSIKYDFKVLMESKVGGKRLQNNLRASSIGFPCDRNHFYSLTEYKEPHSWELQSIFNEGILHERDIEKTLREMGYDVEGNQREFRWENPLITMHIDGMLKKGDKWYPYDAKTINSFDFAKIESAEDIIHSKKPYIRNYCTQILLYMVGTSKDEQNSEYGVLVFKDKQSGKLKDIWFSFDEHCVFADEAIKRAERVYKSVADKTPPERTEDRSLCERCDFKNICLPDLLNQGGLQFLDSADLLYKLEKREELKIFATQYNDLDDEIKTTVKETGAGEKVCGNFLIDVKTVETTRKKPITWSEEKTSYLKINISKV